MQLSSGSISTLILITIKLPVLSILSPHVYLSFIMILTNTSTSEVITTPQPLVPRNKEGSCDVGSVATPMTVATNPWRM